MPNVPWALYFEDKFIVFENTEHPFYCFGIIEIRRIGNEIKPIDKVVVIKYTCNYSNK